MLLRIQARREPFVVNTTILAIGAAFFLAATNARAQDSVTTGSGPAVLAAAQINARLKAGGIDAALSEFRRLQTSNPQSTPMKVLEDLGRSLIAQNRYKDAIRAFRENLMAFPDSTAVYASLGDVYLIDGHRTAARDAYRRAAELDSTNTRARQLSDSLNARLRH
ncbi:MAG: tetratricopeptide repeat protein [Gemmatimonadaceae bacterium]|jgi:Flp pilus assembly protein TadD